VRAHGLNILLDFENSIGPARGAAATKISDNDEAIHF
jgi:hypothetical protein